jgi:inactive STAND
LICLSATNSHIFQWQPRDGYRFVSEESYKLNQAGRDARNELLLLLKIKPHPKTGKFTVSSIKEELFKETLGRITTLTPLLNPTATSRAVPLSKIKEFFMELLERIAGNCRHKYDSTRQSISIDLIEELKCNPIISNKGLREYFLAYINIGIRAKDKWEFPINDLLDEYLPTLNLSQNTNKQPPTKTSTFAPSSQCLSKAPDFNIELLESLWHLDYEAQENIFRTALKGQSKNLAFTFAAPCPVTQSWILNRLLLKIARKDNRRIFTIDLESSKVRNNYDRFLIHLSGLLNTSPDCDRILDRIYEIDSEMSVIIVIKNFRKRQEIQENIMTKFWGNLCSKASEENRLGRVIMFWIDECLLDYECSIVELEELKEIHQVGVEQWINEYSGLYPFLSNISTGDFMSNPCDWKDPFLILDGICNQLKIDKGIVNIQSLWEHQI